MFVGRRGISKRIKGGLIKFILIYILSYFNVKIIFYFSEYVCKLIKECWLIFFVVLGVGLFLKVK